MKEKAQDLVRLLTNDRVVNKIAISENPVEEYFKQAENYAKEISEFLEEWEECTIDNVELNQEEEYEITTDNVLSWCMFFIMAGMEDGLIDVDKESLKDALKKFEGEFSELAHKIEEFIASEKWWSMYTEKELINYFFSKS